MAAIKRRDLPDLLARQTDRHGDRPSWHGSGRASGSSSRPEPCGEPVEADHRAGHQHERKPPPRILIPPHLQRRQQLNQDSE
jgi:hypothetical protein